MAQLIKPDGTPLVGAGIVPLPMSKPFDRERGELIEKFGPNYVIAPMHKWADTPIIDQAVAQARKVFTRRATNTTIPALRFDDSTILIQEYHAQDRIVIIIAAWGRQMGMRKWGWLYHTTVYALPPDLKAHLVLTGRWKAATRH